jgi:hypothetical protein
MTTNGTPETGRTIALVNSSEGHTDLFSVVVRVPGKPIDRYVVRRMKGGYRPYFCVLKLNEPNSGRPYHTCLETRMDLASCDCKGFIFRGYCRHIQGLTALIAAGHITNNEPQLQH